MPHPDQIAEDLLRLREEHNKLAERVAELEKAAEHTSPAKAAPAKAP